MAPRPPSKPEWQRHLIELCKCVQTDYSSQQRQPIDVQRSLNLENENRLYSDDPGLRLLRVKNVDWLDIVKQIHTDWYYTPARRDELISIFVRYDPDKDGQTQLENLKWVMTRAREEEFEEPVDGGEPIGDGEPCLATYSGEAVGRKLLEESPYLILGRNSSEKEQTMLRFAVTLKLEWPIQVICRFYREQCLPNGQLHRRFMLALSDALQEEILGKSVLDTAVASKKDDMVESLVQLLLLCKIDQSKRARPLHNAITAGSDGIARCLVTAFPLMIEEIVDERSVLETLERSSMLKDKATLEDFLVKRIYRVERRPLHVKRLLHGLLGNSKEYHLDLSCFNDPLYSLDVFLAHTEPSFGEDDMFTSIVLPKLLLYVGLPRIQDTGGQSRQSKLCRILDWLVKRKVEGILKLRMPDLEHGPYRESDVGKLLGKFKEIEELNWEKLDMSLEVLGHDETKIRGVQKIWLYSANWGMLSYWTGLEGVITCSQITRVNIVIIKGLIGFETAENYKRRAKARLELRRDEAMAIGRELTYNVSIQDWDVATAPDTSDPDAEFSQSSPSSLLRLEPFLRFYRGLSLISNVATGTPSEVDFSTRVAILDTGVDISQSLLRARIQNGVSFVEYANVESPWWLASDPHGTQMASLIQSIDPKSKLFIAKVGIDRKHRIDPEKIFEGVKWALAQNVDIISISMTFYESHPSLHELLHTAFSKGVTVMCSTADAGQLGPSVYPASWTDRTISVSACNQHFMPTGLTDRRADYFLPGESVSATSLSYAKADKTVSGSSVATAMASGLASLILSCRNYARLDRRTARSVGVQRAEVVKKVFDSMLKAGTGKSVVPDRVFNEEEAIRAMAQERGIQQAGDQALRADDLTWRKWVGEHFAPLMAYDVRENN